MCAKIHKRDKQLGLGRMMCGPRTVSMWSHLPVSGAVFSCAVYIVDAPNDVLCVASRSCHQNVEHDRSVMMLACQCLGS